MLEICLLILLFWHHGFHCALNYRYSVQALIESLTKSHNLIKKVFYYLCSCISLPALTPCSLYGTSKFSNHRMTLFDLYRIPFETAWKFEKKQKTCFIQNFLHNAKFSPKQGGGVQGRGSGRSGGLGGGGVRGDRGRRQSAQPTIKIIKNCKKTRKN